GGGLVARPESLRRPGIAPLPGRPGRRAGARPGYGGAVAAGAGPERTPRMRWHAGARRWLRRVRGWWPDRNPLRRRCDRAEAALFTVLVAVFLAGAPLLALSAGRWAHDSGPPAGHAQPAGPHQVPAVLRTATIQRFAPSPAPASCRWARPCA